MPLCVVVQSSAHASVDDWRFYPSNRVADQEAAEDRGVSSPPVQL